jgi:serine/threonine-protein phosphatase 2B catalytic subunit
MEPLLDPYNDRKVKSVEPPPYLPLSEELLWSAKDMPNWEIIRDHLKKEGKLKKEDVVRMGELALDIIKSEPTLVYMDEPI